MIGVPKEVDPETSETSSYCSSRNPDSDEEDEIDVELASLENGEM